jgi:phosphoribosylglycinamide formyltransferase-1
MPVCAIAYSGRGRLAAAVAKYLLQQGLSLLGIVDRESADRSALANLGVPVYILPNTAEAWLAFCAEKEVAFIVLAGYLRLVPEPVIARYPGRILNSHPALLPAFGGKGMYGRKVHEAVVAEGCTETGFTVHEVTSAYDEGPILYQVRLPIQGLSVEEVEAFVQSVEREIYPAIVWRLWQERIERK